MIPRLPTKKAPHPHIYRAPRSSRKVRVFAWMTDEELKACATRCKINPSYPRVKVIKELIKRGWWRADVTDLSNVRLQREVPE